MILKGIYKNKSLSFCVILLFLLMICSFCVTYIISSIIVGYSNITSIYEYSPQSLIILKWVQILNGVGLFIVPSMLYVYLTDLQINIKPINRQSVLLVIAIILCINPIIYVLHQFNQLLPLPEWLLMYEEKAQNLTNMLLDMQSQRDLITNILALALIPAIAEELFFRGVLQRLIIIRIKNIHKGVIITAMIFSAVHMQFHGFLPRFLLGMILGYFFVFSDSLTLPIIAHFFNNAMVIFFTYPAFSKYVYFDQTEIIFSEFLVAVLLVSLLSYLLYRNLQNYSSR